MKSLDSAQICELTFLLGFDDDFNFLNISLYVNCYFQFSPLPLCVFYKRQISFQDRATQDAPNSDRVATKPYLRQFWGSALTASKASVLTLAISALRKRLLGCPQTRWTSVHRDQKKYCLRRRP